MMKDQLQAMVALTMVAAVSGCAGGGGGSGFSGPTVSVLPADAPLRPGYEPSPCGTLYGYPVPCVPSQRAAIDAAMSGDGTQSPLFGSSSQTSGSSSNSGSSSATSTSQSSTSASLPIKTQDPLTRFDTTTTVTSYYAADGSVSYTEWRYTGSQSSWARLSEGGQQLAAPTGDGPWFSTGPSASLASLAATGQPDILVALKSDAGMSPDAVSPFTSTNASKVELIAKQAAQKWDYQSFGVWNDSTNSSYRTISPMSFGTATPASAVPTAGSAVFTGKLAGFYVAPDGQGSIATADLAVNANFSERSLSFSSSNSRITRDLATATAAPNLNLSGTLTYAPGTNGFSGTLTNAGGTMSGSSKGQFYGPTANELGGVFSVNSPKTVETFTGAYGGKR